MSSKIDSQLGFIHRYFPAKKEGANTLFVLHGTGGDEDDLLSLARMIDGEAAILSPRGKVLENGMPRFFRRFGEGKFDIEDLKFRTAELADFVSVASKKYGFDQRSLVALGYSNGANIAASLFLLRPEILKRAILFRAMLPIEPDKLPDLSDKMVFISAGRFDTMIPKDGTLALEKVLEEAGAKVTMNWEDSTHSLTNAEIVKTKGWLHQ
jgi:phospholipase/carboxylesterase